jgi:RimJ/RimL family protein N-acetyltransferase
VPGRPLTTPRLTLRRWRSADREPFAAINADPEVMEHFPAPLSRRQSDALIDSIEAGFEANGFGLWALELRESGELVGFTGLAVPGFEAHFTPAIEVGWRLARPAWGHGYATEAGRAALAYGFREAGLAEIVSFTTVANRRSRAVMERLGMTHDPGEDFEHPSLPPSHPQRPHVLYRRTAQGWRFGAYGSKTASSAITGSVWRGAKLVG